MTVTIVYASDTYDKKYNFENDQTCWTYEEWDKEALQFEVIESNLFMAKCKKQDQRPKNCQRWSNSYQNKQHTDNALKQRRPSNTLIRLSSSSAMVYWLLHSHSLTECWNRLS